MPYIQNNNAAKIQQFHDMSNVNILIFFQKSDYLFIFQHFSAIIVRFLTQLSIFDAERTIVLFFLRLTYR